MAINPMRLSTILLGFVLCLLALTAQGEMVIRITEGADKRMPLAVVPFGSADGRSAPENLDEIIRNNLTMSGDFELLAPSACSVFPVRG